jgi:hypothetical protein
VKILLLIVKKLLVFSSSFESRKSSFDPGLRRPSQYRHQSKMSSPKKKLIYNGLCDRCLSQFLDWRYSQSCWYFIPSFVNCCPSYLFFSSAPPPLPPLPCVNKFTEYTYTVCKGGGRAWGSGHQTDKHFPQSPFTRNFLNDDILHCHI